MQFLLKGNPATARRQTGLARRSAFSLVEILLVTVLLSLIMLALMAVFNTTQNAFRASITQTDVLEGSRATMDLLAGDFRQLYPSGRSNAFLPYPIYEPEYSATADNPPSAPLNFWLSSPYRTVAQTLIAVSDNQLRTNQVQSFFILTRQNDVWRGVGYCVDTNSARYIYPLYRYDSYGSPLLPSRPTPLQIFTNFSYVLGTQPNLDYNTNLNHLLDGVLHLNVRAYSTNGMWLTNNYSQYHQFYVTNAVFYPPEGGEVAFYMCSNTLPASVEIQMGVLEDRTLQRALSLPPPSPGQSVRSNYLAQQAGKLHLFRQRVNIPNVDPAAYQQ